MSVSREHVSGNGSKRKFPSGSLRNTGFSDGATQHSRRQRRPMERLKYLECDPKVIGAGIFCGFLFTPHRSPDSFVCQNLYQSRDRVFRLPGEDLPTSLSDSSSCTCLHFPSSSFPRDRPNTQSNEFSAEHSLQFGAGSARRNPHSISSLSYHRSR